MVEMVNCEKSALRSIYKECVIPGPLTLLILIKNLSTEAPSCALLLHGGYTKVCGCQIVDYSCRHPFK